MLKKYSITALFSLLLIFTAFTGGVLAETPEPALSPEIAEALADVDRVNTEIETEIVKVQEKAEKMYADYISKRDNAKNIAEENKAWNKYDEKIEAEIAKLQTKTERMTAKGIEKAEAAGLIVEVEWIPVQFADRERKIDPIKVIGW
ncbi:hypothetical protein M4S82_02330 [Planococcus sp. MERTA32b]|nr:hypothetical protein [Planococcus sp. MER TA 32b]